MKHGVQLVLAVLVAAGVGGNLRAAGPEPLQPGAEIRGEITMSASLNHSDGSRSRLYLVEIGERELVSFDVSGPLRAQLSLFDGEELVARSVNQHPAALALRAPRSAAYTLAVSGADSEAFGPYTLRSQVVDGWDGSTLRTGEEVLDWVDGSRELPLRVDRRALYTIDLRSDQFDALLQLSGNGIDAQDDDGGQGTDARLRVVLEPGDYTLTAGGWGGSGQGLYRLAVASGPVPEGLGGGILAPGQQQDALLLPGATDRYAFTVVEDAEYVIDMVSGDFDSWLELFDAEGASIASDDDGGGALNARIRMPLAAGEYVLEASAIGGNGSYRVSISEP